MKLSKSYTYFLIGGGKFLFDTAIEFKKKKIKFEIILSIRHYKDLIKDKDLFIKNGFKVTIFRQDFLDELPLSRNRLSREFRNLSDDDLRTTGMIFVIRAIKK